MIVFILLIKINKILMIKLLIISSETNNHQLIQIEDMEKLKNLD
jgi:hypothetical protein